MASFVSPAAVSSGGTPGGSTTQFQYNDAGTFSGCSTVTWDKSNYTMSVGGKNSQAQDVMRVNRYDGQKQLYVDSVGTTHVGKSDAYTTGGITYENSYPLYFDFTGDGLTYKNYIKALPSNPGAYPTAKLSFFANDSEYFSIGDISGTVLFPNGVQSGASSCWQMLGNNLRTISGASGTVQTQLNSLTLRGEINTAGQYDVKIIGINPFTLGGTASNIAGFYSSSTVMAAVTKEGYLSVAAGSLRVIGGTSTSADPTTTELPSNKDVAIHKNTTTGIVYLAYNDGGTIKKVALA